MDVRQPGQHRRYKAVMIAADEYQRFFPMLMTAAGTVKAARVVILGVGVAAAAGHRHLPSAPAVIEGQRRAAVGEERSDRSAPSSSTRLRDRAEEGSRQGVGGYARPYCRASWLERQRPRWQKRVAQADVVSAALIPGRARPRSPRPWCRA